MQEARLQAVEGGAEAIRELVKLGKAKNALQLVNVPGFRSAVPVMVTEKGDVKVIADLMAKVPDGIQEVVRLNSVVSFIEYVKERKTEHTRVFANTLKSPYTFLAVIDYHECKGTPAWGTHLCILTLTETDEWVKWTSHNDEMTTQDVFAAFIEQNLNDIFQPDGASMLELALCLEATQNVMFKGKINLNNGDTGLVAATATDIRAGADGALKIPKEMVIRLSPFRGIPQMDITARFRTVLRGGHMYLGYQMIRPNAIIDKVITAAYDLITVDAEVKVFSGTVG